MKHYFGTKITTLLRHLKRFGEWSGCRSGGYPPSGRSSLAQCRLTALPVVRNLARQKFVAQFSSVLRKSRHVQFGEMAHHLNDVVKWASNETRMQNFFRETDLSYLIGQWSTLR
ncbi:hypothetical protein GCM10022408_11780 [Hymenobacter fastidiosus]|uniref:Uncharacterized protein n=1 Tax=Hymenobacter fastidiosus TaxID=486264 RepID=A0ABP7RTK8_9BACT